jgi:DNA invertase Pin-like site-specific DNA recombinase
MALTAVYARISLDVDDERAGVGRQLLDCHALAERNGWDTVDFVDNDISASKYTKKSRPEYRAMLARVRGGEVDRIVCYHLDRLYRQPKELEELIDLVDDGAVAVVSVYSGSIDLSNSDGTAMARVLVAFAAKASDDTSRRSRRQRAEVREKGFMLEGPPAFGWLDRRTPHPQETVWILDATRAVLNGETLTGVARSWNRRGVPNKRGGKGWTTTMVRNVLTNPRNAGRMTYEHDVPGPGGKKVTVRETVGKANWPTVVDPETFDRVCAVIDARGSRYANPRRRRLLSSRVFCALCGETMQRGGPSSHPLWRCHKQPGTAGCGKVGIGADALEDHVTRALFHIVDHLDLGRLLAAGSKDDHAAVTIELANLERKGDEYLDMLNSDELDRRGYNRLRQKLRAEQAALRSRLGRLTAGSAVAPYAGRPGALRKVWDDLSLDQQRAIIGDVIIGIEIGPARRGARFDPSRITIGERAEQRPLTPGDAQTD